MPEIKVVISDPEARGARRVKVVVEADPGLPYGEDEKVQRVLPRVKISPILRRILEPELGVVSVRIRKQDGSTAKISGQIVVDKDLEAGVIRLPAGYMREKVGSERAVAEIMRAPSYQITLPQERSSKILGLSIGDAIDGSLLGIPGYRLRITGGSDKAGAPMLPHIHGPGKKYALLSSPPGFRPKEKGLRRRKFVRGDTVGDDTVQVNTVIVERPGKKG